MSIGTPTKAKPDDVTAEQWCSLTAEAAKASWKQNIAIPWSFWPDVKTNVGIATELGEHSCFDVMDIFCGVEDYRPDTPLNAFQDILDCLARGEDVLVLSNSHKIPGVFIAVLTRLLCSEMHIIKLWWPIINEGYDLSPVQLGYIYGLTDANMFHVPDHLRRSQKYSGKDDVEGED